LFRGQSGGGRTSALFTTGLRVNPETPVLITRSAHGVRLPHCTRHARTAALGAVRRPSAKKENAEPCTVSPNAGARLGSVTCTPAGHQLGSSTMVCSFSTAWVLAQSRPSSACCVVRGSMSATCPAACQLSAGVHTPKAKPRHTGESSARGVCVADGAAVAEGTEVAVGVDACARSVDAPSTIGTTTWHIARWRERRDMAVATRRARRRSTARSE